MTGRLESIILRIYVWLFFAYLFLPLLVMMAATFNDSSFPTVTPWRGTTLKWFPALADDHKMWSSLLSSLIVGAGVVGVSLPIGVAAALLLNSLHAKARTIVYSFMVSPLLTPGVIIGISTLVFWRQSFGLSGGYVMLILGQSSFISAYVMLLVLARLQRFDPVLEEAALDLGASHLQTLRRILLPYLMPSIIAAGVLAFLQSFENYNTSLFVRGVEDTLTIYIANKVRTGLEPTVNALGLIMITLTVLGAILYEVSRRRRLHKFGGVS